MRKISGFIVLMVVLAAHFVPQSVLAAEAANVGSSPVAVCAQFENITEQTRCLKTQFDIAQADLADTFDMLLAFQRVEDQEPFKNAQRAWLFYRDLDCAWQKLSTEVLSLQRTEELACLLKLSEIRTNILAAVLEKAEIAAHKKAAIAIKPQFMLGDSDSEPLGQDGESVDE